VFLFPEHRWGRQKLFGRLDGRASVASKFQP
jgi:hypothetical protein